MRENIIQEKSLDFAYKAFEVYKGIISNNEFVLSKQFLRSGTSIGANIEEAINAESKRDFIHKLSISQKETGETMFWIKLLFKGNFLSKSQFDELNTELNSLMKLIRTIILRTKGVPRKIINIV